MRILFVGNGEEYRASILTRENDRPFSLFFCPSLTAALEQSDADAIVIPALRFLSSPLLTRTVPLIASGTAELAEPCFEAGCSDFIREPWTGEELHARMAGHAFNRFAFNHEGLRISGHTLIGPAAEIALSDAAYSIFTLLAANLGQPVPRLAIAAVLGVRASNSRSVDMRIARLRSALRSAGAGDIADRLRCSHGGYQLST